MEPESKTALEQLQKSLQTFGSLAMAAESRDKLYRYNDALMQSLYSILDDCDCDEAVKLETFNTTMEQYAAAMKDLFPKLLSTAPKKPAICKSDPDRFDEIQEVKKFNPYHDSRGRFSSANSAASFTHRTRDPSKQHWADAAIAREKERSAAAEPPKPKFTPAKTKKEAVAYAKDQLGFSEVSYGTKLDMDTINHINEEITKIQAAQPMVKGTVSSIKTTTRKGIYAQVTLGWDGSMSLQIGTNLYGRGLDYIKQSYDRDVKSGFHPEGTDYKAIIHHEYGHVMAGISAKNMAGLGAKDPVGSMDTRISYMRSLRGHTTEKGWLFEAAQKTGQKPSEMMQSISRYAQKNPGETFAEAYAEFACSPNPRASAVAIVEASGWHRQ